MWAYGGANMSTDLLYTHVFVNVFYSRTDAQVIVLKAILKFTLKQLRHLSVLSVTTSSGSALLVLAKITLFK
jgi:hypothetical protein